MKRLLLIFAVLLGACAHAQAAVVLSFYAHQLSSRGIWVEFPHAYVTLNGTTAVGALPVKANFGFTPPIVGLSILLGRVNGDVVSADDAYIAADKPRLTLTLTDPQYSAVLAVVAKWRGAAQPSYDLDTHNCVIFVKEIAAAVGLGVSDNPKFVRDPAAFMDDLASRNTVLLAHSGAATFGAFQNAEAGAVAHR